MKITADTNILVRVIVRDDLAQAQAALEALSGAERVFVPLPCLCEFAWVLERSYGLSRQDIAAALGQVVSRANVETDVQAVNAGLRVLEAGGDFADGVIASVGAQAGADMFVSFDRKAVSSLTAIGIPAELTVAGI